MPLIVNGVRIGTVNGRWILADGRQHAEIEASKTLVNSIVLMSGGMPLSVFAMVDGVHWQVKAAWTARNYFVFDKSEDASPKKGKRWT